jgi:protein-tyrosine phosphatase
MDADKKIAVLFVCTANICRSPTAEAMFRSKAEKAGILEQLHIDSAATHDYKIGQAPDTRSQEVARKRGYDMSTLRARLVSRADLEQFDFISAMDIKNLTILHRLGEPDLWQKPKLMMSYSRAYKAKEVPDPYGGPAEGFDLALDMLESATDGLLVAVQSALSQGDPVR